jgi:flagellar motor switch protein FliG
LLSLYAQVPQAEQAHSLAMRSRKASHYYERLIKDVLSKYYDERTFLIDVRVSLGIEGSQEDQDFENLRLSSGIKSLPGLPVLPDELRSEPSSSPESNEPDKFIIKSVDVDIMVDTSYEKRDEEFIKELITMSANLDKYRGDIFKIRKGVFPVHKRAADGYRLAETLGADSLKSGMNSASGTFSNPFMPYVSNLASLIPLLIICVFVLLVVWVVVKAVLANSKRPDSESYTQILAEIKNLRNNIPSEGKTSEGGEVDEISSEYRQLRSYLLSSFVGNPHTSTEVLKSWFQKDSEKGLRDAGLLIKAVDDKLLDVISRELDSSIAQALEKKIKEIEPLAGSEAVPILKEFKTGFEMYSRSSVNENEFKDIFGFLKQLNDQQLLHLLKEESAGIAGMLLAQLDPGSAARIIQKMDASKRTKVLAGMGKIENIPIKAYKELADRLSIRALEVVNMRYVASDGVESVLEILDSLPLNVQDDYLNSITEIDLHLAEKIKSTFITYAEVPGLPDAFLGKVVREVDRDTLIMAMAGSEESLQSKILELLPDRMKLMVKSGIETNADASQEQIESAQKQFLLAIRQEIKISGRPE